MLHLDTGTEVSPTRWGKGLTTFVPVTIGFPDQSGIGSFCGRKPQRKGKRGAPLQHTDRDTVPALPPQALIQSDPSSPLSTDSDGHPLRSIPHVRKLLNNPKSFLRLKSKQVMQDSFTAKCGAERTFK